MTGVDIDIDLDLSEPAPPAREQHRDFSVSLFPGARAMDTEELVDIRQQADFFMELGQHEQAIEVLSTRISPRAGTLNASRLPTMIMPAMPARAASEPSML